MMKKIKTIMYFTDFSVMENIDTKPSNVFLSLLQEKQKETPFQNIRDYINQDKVKKGLILEDNNIMHRPITITKEDVQSFSESIKKSIEEWSKIYGIIDKPKSTTQLKI